MVDAATERPRRISDHEREAWEPYLGESITFKRR
jgi:acyl-CoA thioester hydrolase